MSSSPPAKKLKSDTAESDESKDFDNETQKALEEIDACQNQIDALNEKASEDILKVEQKFNKLRKPFFDRRNEIIARLPNFWITAFVNHPQMTLILHEEEEDLLHYLAKIDVDEYEDIKFGYKISLHFVENPYFENDVLTKEFFMGGMETRSTSTPIRWKEGKNIIQNIKDKESQNQGKKRASESRGFMTWFVDNSDPSLDEIAEIIKDDMWPNPLQYYLAPDIEIREGMNGDEEEEEGSEDDADDSIVIVEDEEEDDDSIVIGSDTDDIEAVELSPAKEEAEGNVEGETEGESAEDAAEGGDTAEGGDVAEGEDASEGGAGGEEASTEGATPATTEDAE